MPSIGAVNAMIVAQKIDEGIKREFPEEQREDAYKVLRLSGKAGDTTSIITTAVCGPFLSFAILFSRRSDSLLLFLGGIILTGIALYVLAKKRKLYQRKLNELIASNPYHWGPIVERLIVIIRDGGKNVDLFRSRITKIVNS